jgi:hypothetical protein
MAWAGWQWMSVELPLEEQLMLERQVRAVHDHVNAKEIAELCSSLIRQNFHQQKLLQQAVTRIMELETIEEYQDDEPEPLPWWRNVLLRFKS